MLSVGGCLFDVSPHIIEKMNICYIHVGGGGYWPPMAIAIDHCWRISSQGDNKRYCSRGFDQRCVWVAAAQLFIHLINNINTSWGSKQN